MSDVFTKRENSGPEREADVKDRGGDWGNATIK
jgi:hypothetical protein